MSNDPKVSQATEDVLGEVASRLDDAEEDGVQFSGAGDDTAEYLKDRAKNVETWDGDNG